MKSSDVATRSEAMTEHCQLSNLAPFRRLSSLAVAGCVVVVWSSSMQLSAEPLDSGIPRRDVEDRSYLSYAIESLDNLIAHGADHYGSVSSPLLVSNLDVRTKENPQAANLGSADEVWRVERRQRRAPGGANFLHNQSVYRAMRRASQVTGNNSYADFVDANIDWATANVVDSSGLFWWGWHRHYDVHTDEMLGEPDHEWHEMHAVDIPLWEVMWNRNSAAVQTQIEQMWTQHVVDKNTGLINRHQYTLGGTASINISAASFIEAFAFMSTVQPEIIPGETDPTIDTWIERAHRLDDYNWNRRDPSTNLIADIPNLTSRWEGHRSTTTTPGVYAPALLRAYQCTNDAKFKDRALAYMIGWATEAFDTESESFWGSLELDGTPVPGPRLTSSTNSDQYEPRGLIDMWAPESITAEHNPDAAQAYLSAYVTFDDPFMLTTAERWAKLVQQNLPAKQTLQDTWYDEYSDNWAPEGTYAEHYGRLIDFFTRFYIETNEDHYLFTARDLAKEAVSTLWYEGLFRGHPNKPYYEAIDGVGILLESLIDLDQQATNFKKFGDFDDDNDVDLTDYQTLTDHWLQEVSPYEDGDVTGDGRVDLYDFSRFKHEYFEGAAESLANPNVVPEPRHESYESTETLKVTLPEPTSSTLLIISLGVTVLICVGRL